MRYTILLIVSFLAMQPLLAQAQGDTSYVLNIKGDIPAGKITFTQKQLSAMKRVEIKARSMDGEIHIYSGVLVSEVLKMAGVLKPEFHRDNLVKCLLVRSTDNYQVLFSLAEIDTAYSDNLILLADIADGKPLPPAKGPYRIIVPSEEKRQARWIWSVKEFVIRFAKEE